MSTTVFLLGAGFSIDAAAEAGNPQGVQEPARYPLVSGLARSCFDLDAVPSGKSIEQLFDDHIKKGNSEPLGKLCNCIMEADYFITKRLVYDDRHKTNAYRRFLEDFSTSPLLTFNYDSLPELFLVEMGLWRPDDGYGVPVRTELAFSAEPPVLPEASTRPVLHLHGSLCVYAVERGIRRRPGHPYAMIVPIEVPKFIFDPGAPGDCFRPFQKVPFGMWHVEQEERIIAPVPDKAEGLKDEFVKAVYETAETLIAQADRIAVIGYSFNPHDHASYNRLVRVAKGRSVLVVAPDADDSIDRLRSKYPEIRWVGQSLTFKNWVGRGYPGLEC